MSDLNKKIATIIKEDLKSKKINQLEFSKMIGIKAPVASRMLNGKRPFSVLEVMKIAKILDIREKLYTA